MINSVAFKKRHHLNPDDPLSLEEIADLSGMPRAALQEVYNRGIGAWKTNPASVRIIAGHKLPKEQWAYARVYSFVMKRDSTFRGSDRDIAVKYKLL